MQNDTAEIRIGFTVRERIKAALLNELSRWKRRGSLFLYFVKPRGTGAGPGVLQAALYFGITGYVIIRFGIIEGTLPDDLTMGLEELAALVLISWSTGYIYRGILTAQVHARHLEVELERTKARLDRLEEKDRAAA